MSVPDRARDLIGPSDPFLGVLCGEKDLLQHQLR
jgi:hypothetical protein